MGDGLRRTPGAVGIHPQVSILPQDAPGLGQGLEVIVLPHLELDKPHALGPHQLQELSQLGAGAKGEHGAVSDAAFPPGPENIGEGFPPGVAGGIQQGRFQGAKSGGGGLCPGLFLELPQGGQEAGRRDGRKDQDQRHQGFPEKGQAVLQGLSGDKVPGYALAKTGDALISGNPHHQVIRARVGGQLVLKRVPESAVQVPYVHSLDDHVGPRF